MAKPELEKKHINPFYVALVVTGVVFLVTAFAYGVMTVKMLDPEQARAIRNSKDGLMPFLDAYGFRVLMIEIAVLTLTTLGAIGTDRWWRKRS